MFFYLGDFSHTMVLAYKEHIYFGFHDNYLLFNFCYVFKDHPNNHVFAPLISMPHFNSNNFFQNRPKMKLLFPKKNKTIFSSAGAPPPDSLLVAGGCPVTAPPHC